MSDVIEEPSVVPAPTASAQVINQINIQIPTAKAVKPGATSVRPSEKKVERQPDRRPLNQDPGFILPILPLPLETVQKEYYTDDATGEQVTRLKTKDATATYRESTTDHNKITFTLKDAKGELVTRGDARGFVLKKDGNVLQSTTNWPVLRDTLNCPAGRESIGVNKTESVTREKLQEFAENHPQLASALRGVELPVTVTGNLPVSFAKAVATPTQYRACPEDRSGIVIERLTKESAKR